MASGQPRSAAKQGDARSKERQVRGNHVNANVQGRRRLGRFGGRKFAVMEAGGVAVMEAGGVVDSSTLEDLRLFRDGRTSKE